MATMKDAERAQAEADEKAQRRAAARERMISQIEHGSLVSVTEAGKIYATPICPWCQTPFDAATWDLYPSLKGQYPLIDVMLGGMAPMGDHEATCPTCGFKAQFKPKKEG
jgi:rubrerythrin